MLTAAEYNRYITSKAWQARRRTFFKKYPYRCRACDGGQELIELHHRTYVRLGAELDGDLTPLCQTCHAALHDYHRRHPEMDLAGASDHYIRAAVKARTRPTKKKRERPAYKVSPEEQDALRRLNQRQRRFVPVRERMTLSQRLAESLDSNQGLPVVKVQPRRS